MQFVNGRLVTDEERYSGPTRVYFVDVRSGSFTKLREFEDVKEGDEFVRQNSKSLPHLTFLYSTNDTLVPVQHAVATLCHWVKTGRRG